MKISTILASVFAALLFNGNAHAQGPHLIVIRYDLVSLGGTAYRYDYSITNGDGSGMPIELFDILFDPAIYLESSLIICTPEVLGLSWDQNILASAPDVPAAYDSLALAGGIAPGTTVAGFAVKFSWLGSGTPGDQPFEIYAPTTFELVEQGLTSQVPEPATYSLLGLGIGVAFCRRKAAPGKSRLPAQLGK